MEHNKLHWHSPAPPRNSSGQMNFYLQDILNECSAPEKFQEPETNRNDKEITLIVDFGSWQCRVGRSCDPEPSSKDRK